MKNQIQSIIANQPFLRYILENSKNQSQLMNEIETYDLPFLHKTYNSMKNKTDIIQSYRNIEPAACDEILSRDLKEHNIKSKCALSLIKNGYYAVVILAGGLGTRLGFNGPKGMMELGGENKKCLFQLHLEHIRQNCNRMGGLPYVFIMTSYLNDSRTREMFKMHDSWGYPIDKIKFFVQGSTPIFDSSFIIQAISRNEIATSPDGNGHWFKYLFATYPNLVSSIKWISVVSIDNALQNIVDLNFIGSTMLSGKGLGAKVIKKKSSDEKMGTICRADGRDCVIEYFELPKKIANLRNLEKNLVYSYGVTLNYLFNVTYLLQDDFFKSMPLHLVKKETNVLKSVNNPNELVSRQCYKFEVFILDQVSWFKDVYFYEVDREYEFAPIKNRVGQDSLESAQHMIRNRGISL